MAIKNIIMSINLILLVIEVVHIFNEFSYIFFLGGLIINILTSVRFMENKYQASRNCFVKSAIFVIPNVYVFLEILLKNIHVQDNILHKIMISVIFLMLSSFFTIVPCIITFGLTTLRTKNNLENTKKNNIY